MLERTRCLLKSRLESSKPSPGILDTSSPLTDALQLRTVLILDYRSYLLAKYSRVKYSNAIIQGQYRVVKKWTK